MTRVFPILVLVLLVGRVSRPHFDEQVLQFYQSGKQREEIQKSIGSPPMTSVARPKEGWRVQRHVNRDADSLSVGFEAEKKVEVHRVDVYWLGRGTSIPLAVGGVWWDYLFYDAWDRLIGYRRRFLD